MSHACPATGGAHKFVPDPAGVPVCACGEMEMSPDEELDLIEIEHEAATMPLRPRERRRPFVRKLGAIIHPDYDDARLDEWTEGMLTAQEENGPRPR